MTTYKALFLDIDGTILKPDHTFDPSTKEAILQVQEQGIEVFLATGRPLHEEFELAKALNIHSYIGYNGALAVHRGEVLVSETIDPGTVHSFVDIAKKHNHEIGFYTSERNFFTSLDDEYVQNFFNTLGFKQNHLFHKGIADQILSITIMKIHNDDYQLYEVNPDFRFAVVNVDGLRNSYDLIQKSVNKGRAVQAVLSTLGIKPEQAIAFGDAMNDKEMLSLVGEGFAMGNAMPELLPFAKHQTTDVTDSGIFNGLQSLGLVK